MNELKVAIVGLDSSHSINCKQNECPGLRPQARVDGRVVSCMRFETRSRTRRAWMPSNSWKVGNQGN